MVQSLHVLYLDIDDLWIIVLARALLLTLMKTLVLVCSLVFLVACGKETKESNKSYSLTDLQSQGIYFVASGQTLAVLCSSDGSTTNQTRLNSLQSFLGSIGVDSSKTRHYELSGVKIDPQRMKYILQQAIMMLQQSSYQSNPYSYGYGHGNTNYQSQNTQCPSQILSQG